MSTASSREIGIRGEDEAVRYLISCGYMICARNFRVRGGEIDIVARAGDELIFIEVKARAVHAGYYPEERVDFFKKRFLSRAIKEYIRRFHIPDTTYLRTDIIACDWNVRDDTCAIRHVKNIELFS